MSLDEEILRVFNRDLQNPALAALFVFVSLLGEFAPFLVVAVPLWRRGHPWRAGAFLVAMVAAELATLGLKQIIARPRPANVVPLLDFEGPYAMPSGHAMRAWAAVAVVWGLGSRWRTVFVAFGVLTLVSRVYVGAHYPSDVLAGAGLGLLVGRWGLAATAWLRDEWTRERESRRQETI